MESRASIILCNDIRNMLHATATTILQVILHRRAFMMIIEFARTVSEEESLLDVLASYRIYINSSEWTKSKAKANTTPLAAHVIVT